MNQFFEIKVTDRSGWGKTFSIEQDKSIVYIGADADNDIVLDSSRGIAPRHAQLIWVSGQGYRLVNLGTEGREVRVNSSGAMLSSHAFTDVVTGSSITMGDFTLTFQFGANFHSYASSTAISVSNTSRNIELKLSLPRTKLVPERELEGQVIVRNLGKVGGIQFKLDVSGMPSECYDDITGQILAPGTCGRPIPLRLRHTEKSMPPAGKYTLIVRASAQAAYPGEVVSVSHNIFILPYYQHTMRILRIE